MSVATAEGQSVAAIGPSKLLSAAEHLGITVAHYEARLKAIAECLSQFSAALTINADSESTRLFARFFLQSGGGQVRYCRNYLLDGHSALGEGGPGVALAPEHIPLFLVKGSDVILCVGLGTGTLLEICLAKFESHASVLVLSELITRPLPKECTYDRLHYVGGVGELRSALSKHLRQITLSPQWPEP